jgi:hypothetical protein
LRIRGRGGHSTHVFLITSNLDVSLISPSGSPGVLDQPVVLACLDTITDSENTMVEILGIAVRFVIDT